MQLKESDKSDLNYLKTVLLGLLFFISVTIVISELFVSVLDMVDPDVLVESIGYGYTFTLIVSMYLVMVFFILKFSFYIAFSISKKLNWFDNYCENRVLKKYISL